MEADSPAPALDSARSFGRPTTITILLFLGFSMKALAAMIEPLRAANLLSGNVLYEWKIVSPDAADAVSSSGFHIEARYHHLAVPPSDLLLVVASLDFERQLQPRFLARLAAAARSCKSVGAVSNGSMLLAEAGLLDGFRSTVHWERLREMQQRYPATRTSQEVYCIDRDRWTCSGGTAAMDMMLALIRAQHGQALAIQVVNNFLHGRMRWPGDMQPMEVRWRYGIKDRRLARAIGFMEQSIETPLKLVQIADLAGLLTRQLQRLFVAEMHQSPEQFFVALRLQVAHDLLKHNDDAVSAIALQCGFGNSSHFARAFKAAFGRRPSESRRARSLIARGDSSAGHPGSMRVK
jgi:transcriptional regulator GlxA family with amidase domain